jgi:hypothetical protein
VGGERIGVCDVPERELKGRLHGGPRFVSRAGIVLADVRHDRPQERGNEHACASTSAQLATVTCVLPEGRRATASPKLLRL